MARPRSVTDEAILQEAYLLIMQAGPSKLTFEALGTRVGLSPAALAKRFKSRRLLVLEIDRYALKRTDERLAAALHDTASPVRAIVEQFVAELEFATSIEHLANGQEFLLMDLRDKELYDNYHKSFATRHHQIVELLHRAETAGELQHIADHDTLARHLALIAHGAGHVWAMTQTAPIKAYITDHILLALQPYRK